ncbi:MAG: type II toxin-antitoxin system RelE/ParE family toxin [Deltaproteobacteria bacterium]|nr:type II toxin-antitoxin system RelE/ParE family toxin [Deltaproteobacteria bacterium]
MFAITWDRRARDEVARLGAFDRTRIVDEVEAQLSSEPAKADGRRKWIDGLAPPWSESVGFWQLAVGPYRVFYDVDQGERMVVVRAVRLKGRRKTAEIVP